MLAVRFDQHGGPEVLKCEEMETPSPGLYGRAFPLSQAIEAHRLLEGRQTKGKLVILPWKDI